MGANAAPSVNLLEPTLKRVARIWWAFFWRAMLLAFGAGLLAGFFEGYFGMMAGLSRATVQHLNILSGFALGLPAGMYALYLILKKNFGEFTIRLVASQPTE